MAHHTVGQARLEPPQPAGEDQAYDLASLTKALVGATVAASLCADGRIALDGPVCRWVEGVPAGITVGHLLHHSSGLPAWSPLYEDLPASWGTAGARAAVLDRVIRIPPDAPPGAVHRYSDLGFLLLLPLLERAGDAPLDVLFHDRVLRHTGSGDLRWGWPHAAATERCPVRGLLVQGTVHDLNCAAMGGISTHAGLFGTARSVAALADAIRAAAGGATSGLPGAMLRRFWTERGPGSHRLGWDGISGGYTSTGGHFPPDSVGHLGYTGCSVWVVPSRETVVALLTNRVHPVDHRDAIRRVRPRVHDTVAHVLGWAG